MDHHGIWMKSIFYTDSNWDWDKKKVGIRTAEAGKEMTLLRNRRLGVLEAREPETGWLMAIQQGQPAWQIPWAPCACRSPTTTKPFLVLVAP